MHTSKQHHDTEFEFSDNWEEQARLLQQLYPELTVHDLKYEPGKAQQVVERIARKLDLSTEEVVELLNNQ